MRGETKEIRCRLCGNAFTGKRNHSGLWPEICKRTECRYRAFQGPSQVTFRPKLICRAHSNLIDGGGRVGRFWSDRRREWD